LATAWVVWPLFYFIASWWRSGYMSFIPDIVMSNNTKPEYGFEGEKSYVCTSDAESHCCLAG
jgi:hypothetical protein